MHSGKDSAQNKIFTIPNLLSFFRLCLIPVIVWLYAWQKNYLLAGLVLIVSGVTDVVDGFVARHFGLVSDLGKILDPVADKLTQGAVLLCLMLRFWLMCIPVLMMLAKEVFVGLTGILAVQKTGDVYGAQWHGKVATLMLYAMMLLHLFWYNIPNAVSIVSIILCTVMVGVSFVEYAMKNIRLIQGAGGEGAQ